MQISLLTPAGGLVALVALLPLTALALTEVRARRVREVLALRAPSRTFTVMLALAVFFAGILVGAAAAQPVLERGVTRSERTDVNAYVVIDGTRSMLAASGRRAASRLARARAAARELRTAVPELRVGLASFTDRMLPHLFPTSDADVYAATLEHSIGIERPPPSRPRRNATDLNALQQLGAQGYFPATPERRIVVVLSDFETDPFSTTKLGAALRRQRLEPLFVHLWDGEERIFGGLGDAGYRPDPASVATVRRLAEASRGRAFAEAELGEAKAALRTLLGDGPRRPLWQERSRTELAPWLSLAAILPLGFVLWRRNLR
jgi:VWA domain-containing protein